LALVKAFDLVDFNIVPVKKNIATLSNALWLNVPGNSRSNYLISSKKAHSRINSFHDLQIFKFEGVDYF
jgi:hypothetical protein